MRSTLIKNIRLLAGTGDPGMPLAGKSMALLPSIPDAWLLIEDGTIAGFGKMEDLSAAGQPGRYSGILDAKGRIVMPCWCDSHTHIVFAGSREDEMVAKILGRSYAEIHAAGGGILHSAKKLNAASEDQLFAAAWERVQAVSRLGTGALEIKSGYGLTVEGELKMLRVIRKIREKSGLTIRASFLGAHSYPLEYKDDHQGYINLIRQEMLPVIARERLADYMDVFCEEGFFTAQEAETLCMAGKEVGLKTKLHVNQLHSVGGIEAGIRLKAVSLDHLEIMSDGEIRSLAAAQQADRNRPLATLLPTAAFYLRMPLQPARKLIDAGCAVALASDFNPGSSPSGNMNFVVSLACIQMRMLPEEAINAATINGAFAMDAADGLGSIATGKKANLIITTPVPSLAYLPYAFGTNCIEKVLINGEPVA